MVRGLGSDDATAWLSAQATELAAGERMFGSTRFMAPEEYVLGARIDQRTTVFTLGRTAQQFLASGGEYSEGVAGLIARACEGAPELRFESVSEFYRAWSLVARGECA